MVFRFCILSLCLLAGLGAPAGAVVPRDRSVEIGAVVQVGPPRITLQWNAPAAAALVQQKVYRRLKGGGAWGEVASLPREVVTWADEAVAVGVSYEYFVYRVYDGLPGTASGWISAAIRGPLVADRGRVIVLVDDTMATPLAAELTQWTTDLVGDGWTVVRQNVSRTAAVPAVRGVVQSLYAADPANTVGLILFGHLPVPYAGDYSADGHPEHFGAWPADAYYGDVDGVWTDATVNDSRAALARNRNVPGDGKFDQSVLPSDVDLQVGRIDLAAMPAFALSETELLRQYLGRDHAFRHQLGAYANVPRRALVDDNFGFPTGEVFAASAWRSFGTLFGSANVQALDWFGTLGTQKYLGAYACGPGSYVSEYGVGNTTNFATQPTLAVFNFLFGSFNGDWDSQDNFLRAPLGGPAASLGLVSAWVGRPHWFFHPLGQGETIGYCARLAQNNVTSFPGGYEADDCERAPHIALLGDPTLRLHPVLPPSGLTAQVGAGNTVALSWTASGDTGIEGYLVARATSPQGPFARLSGALIGGTSFTDRSVTAGLAYTYMVRAVKLETTSSGSYLNPSQGIFSAPVAPAAASGAEINVVGNGQMIGDDDTVALRANGTDFGPLEVGQAPLVRTFTVRSPGTAPLVISSVLVAGANAADFTVSNAPTTIAAGQTQNFNVAFNPSAVGDRTARLTILNNDPNEAEFDFALAGTGVAPPAVLEVNTTSVDVTVAAGRASTATIRITNRGNGPLTYTASSSLNEYSARDSDALGGPTYNWVDISATGTLIQSWSDPDDGATADLPLGFTFPFYGNGISAVRICTNGFIGTHNLIPFGQNGPLPNSSAAMNMIAPFWTDVILDTGSRVFWQNVGGSFIVQYDNVSLLGTTDRRFTCQAILQPTGEIFFQYKTLSAIGHAATIGIQNALLDTGLLIAYSADYAHPNLAIRIRPPGLETWLTLPATAGSVNPNAEQQIPVTLNTAALAPGDYFATVTIRANTADEKAVAVPVHVTVMPLPAEIAIYPPAVNRSIHAGDTVTETLQISDPGPGPLVHTISTSPGSNSWLSLGANSGTIASGGSQQISATLNAATLAAGDYSAEVTIASNALGNASVIIPVRLTVGATPVENWRLLHFGTTDNSGDAADTADRDGDARNNLLEYALVTEPLAFEANALPAITVNLSGYTQMQFRRDATRTDLRYLIEATADLTAGWTTIASGIHGAPVIATGAHSSTESGSGDVKTVTVEDSAPASIFTTRYLRLRILRD
jgi:hypothetical protein